MNHQTDPTVILVLEGALSHIKQGWVQEYSAQDSDGNLVHPTHSTACKWCLTGALIASSSGMKSMKPASNLYLESSRACERVLGIDDLATWNDADKRSQEDVIELLGRVISHTGRNNDAYS